MFPLLRNMMRSFKCCNIVTKKIFGSEHKKYAPVNWERVGCSVTLLSNLDKKDFLGRAKRKRLKPTLETLSLPVAPAGTGNRT